KPPKLSLTRIRAWARIHRRATGRWPDARTGAVMGVPGETWAGIDAALIYGRRGLEGGTTLNRLMGNPRAVDTHNRPRLTVKQIRGWADEPHRTRGRWQTAKSGPIPGAPGEKWVNINMALKHGLRGLRTGLTLTQFLAKHRRVDRDTPLSVDQVLAWADAQRQATGAWPGMASGAVIGAPGEKWGAINTALRDGHRGRPGRTTLARLLAQHRGVEGPKMRPALSLRKTLDWARAHRRATGKWPTKASGPVADAPGETWSKIDAALAKGLRGLDGGTTLA